eukprot:CAMPEP_0176189486 /NCGR_PEP_ID=MMETSP0121_2-20121125/3455_1 /TAXON_ID=160619 /ORGANISM="Kryptoperidinium foliaceum, Strain CCMP 1326" /LENGTH=161 /DNA_ID=CAMNT_0017528093 /DNA_START=359 /DNA_END=845 /DNA_ORIENTATION=-
MTLVAATVGIGDELADRPRARSARRTQWPLGKRRATTSSASNTSVAETTPAAGSTYAADVLLILDAAIRARHRRVHQPHVLAVRKRRGLRNLALPACPGGCDMLEELVALHFRVGHAARPVAREVPQRLVGERAQTSVRASRLVKIHEGVAEIRGPLPVQR